MEDFTGKKKKKIFKGSKMANPPGRMVPSREKNYSKSSGAKVCLKCLKNPKESSMARVESTAVEAIMIK